MIIKIRSEKDLRKYDLRPGDKGVWYGGLFFSADGNLYDFSDYNPNATEIGRHSRVKKRNKLADTLRAIKIVALINAILLITYLGWKDYLGLDFLAPIMESQIKVAEGILRMLGLL